MSILLQVALLLSFLSYLTSSETLNVQTRHKNEEIVQSAIQKLITATKEIITNDFIRPSSCAELKLQGYNQSGIYTIYPKRWFDKLEMTVFCDMETDGGGWTLFQRRDNFDIRQNFIQDWEAYRKGFGQLDREFWLGNDNLHILTNQDYVTLRIELADFDGDNRYVVYNEFQIAGCHDRYRLKIGKFSGNTGDGMEHVNNHTFFTFDEDNTNKCAAQRESGWWFNACSHCNLNGLYLNGTNENEHQGVVWYYFRGSKYSLKKSEMKIRPSRFRH